MKSLLCLWLCLAGMSMPAQAESWRFALIGDTPYSDYERQQFPGMLQGITAEHVDFIAHVGDIKHSQEACSDALFEDRQQIFNASAAPFIFVPGDNEWTDCRRVAAGHHDPLERLAALRQRFMPTDESLGQRRIALQRQPGEYREHQRWQLGPILFATLNVPGPSNNYLISGEPGREARSRMPFVLNWLRDSFALARQQQFRGIVVLMQANPGFKNFNAGLGHKGFRTLLEALRDETRNFSGQVVLVHGDTHWQRVDHPLRDPASGKPLPNFTRVETFGYPFLGWVKGFIDTDAPGLFRFEAHTWSPQDQ
jgi:hypothetical protein